jgi:hypothetical protein
LQDVQATYAPELHLVGTVSVVPAADMSDYPAAAADQTLNRDQIGTYIGILRGLERTHPDFNIDDYRHGLAKEKWEVVSGCAEPPAAQERVKLLDQLTPSDFVPATPRSATAALRFAHRDGPSAATSVRPGHLRRTGHQCAAGADQESHRTRLRAR